MLVGVLVFLFVVVVFRVVEVFFRGRCLDSFFQLVAFVVLFARVRHLFLGGSGGCR